MSANESGFFSYEGSLPLEERTRADVSEQEILTALAGVRDLMDENLGTTGRWTNIEDRSTPIACGGYAVNEARQDLGIAGMIRGFDPSKKAAAVSMVRDAVEPLGYTAESTSNSGETVQFVSRLEGGFVDVRLTPEGLFSIGYSTDCRPAEDFPRK